MRAARYYQGMRFLSKGLALILVLSGLFVVFVLIHPGDHHTLTLGDNLLQGLLEGMGVLLTLPLWLPGDGRRGSSAPSLLPDKAETHSTQRWVLLLLGLGILSYVIGQAIWTYNEDIAHLPVLFPSWADAGYLGSYPFVLCAILFLPRRRLPAQTRVRIVLDSLLIMVGLVTLSWYFVLGPTILRGSDTWWGQMIGTAYPLATLVLLFCLLLLGLREYDRALQPVVLLLFLALAILVITDSIYDYQELHTLYMTGGLLDVGWPLGYLLVGLSAHAMRRYLAVDIPAPASMPGSSPRRSRGWSPALWQASIPLLVVPAALALLIWTQESGGNPALRPGVILGVTLLLGLMIVRQVIVTRETISQNLLLQRMHQDEQASNEALRRANERLEKQAQTEQAYEQQRRLNELKDQFIRHVSHELRTPLTRVYGYLELLSLYHRRLPSERQDAYIQRAMQGCETLLHLINTVLDATQVEDPTLHLRQQRVLVQEVVHEIGEQFGLQQQRHLLDIEVAEGLAVQADAQALSQVLRNLLSNAFKYAPLQSPVRVVASRGDPDARRPDRHAAVCICVQDSGPGIAAEDLPLLFGRFVRLKRDLAGSIRGSRFCFTLPAWDQPTGEEERA